MSGGGPVYPSEHSLSICSDIQGRAITTTLKHYKRHTFVAMGLFANHDTIYKCSICGKDCKGGFIHGMCAKFVREFNPKAPQS